MREIKNYDVRERPQQILLYVDNVYFRSHDYGVEWCFQA